MKNAESVDFAIFVLTPDDTGIIRGENKNIARDNVLFELGLFIGTLGKERCFIIKPRDIELYLPTDLLGLTSADYDGNRTDNDLHSAVNAPCAIIKKSLSNLGLISKNTKINKKKEQTNYDYKIDYIEHSILVEIHTFCSKYPQGRLVENIFDSAPKQEGYADKLGLSLAKLERMGFVSKKISEVKDRYGKAYNTYFYSITDDGLDFLLRNEHLTKTDEKSPIVDDFLDDVPF